MPGVQGNDTNGNATTNVGVVNGSGSRGAASAVYVDGVVFVRAGGNGDPRYVWTAISVDAIDQFQVQTTGYSAIYEGQGVMNYTIKQGGAKQHGSVYEFIRNTAFDTWGFLAKAPNPITGVAGQAGRAQQRVRHQPQRPARSLRQVEGKGLLLRQLQRIPLYQRDADADDLPHAEQQSGNFTASGTSRRRHGRSHLRPVFADTPAPRNSTNGYPAGISTAMVHRLRAQVPTAIRRCSALRIRSMSSLPASCPRLQRAMQALLPTTGIIIGSAKQLHRPQRHGSHQLVHHGSH